MAITKTLTEAIPHENSSNEVERWQLTMVYEQGDKTFNAETEEYTYAANYFDIDYSIIVHATEPLITGSNEGVHTFITVTNFTELDKTAWSLANLIALCPTTKWDTLFDRQYDSLITNPLEVCVPDDGFVIPS